MRGLAAISVVALVAALLLVPTAAAAVDCEAQPASCGTLTVELDGLGSGTVRSNDPGGEHLIDCARQPDGDVTGTCSHTYDLGADPPLAVAYSLLPDVGNFACVDETVCGDPGGEFALGADGGTLRVTFHVESFDIFISNAGSGNGTVTVNGRDCGGDCEYSYGTHLDIVAVPDAGSRFAGWAGDCAGAGAHCSLVVTAHVDATAFFELVTTEMCWGRTATIVGTSGNDVLVGTAGSDVIVGLGGNDVILGRSGNDRLCGKGGDDEITGGLGDDVVSGGPGFDTVSYEHALNAVEVDLAAGAARSTGSDILSSLEAVIGSDRGDRLFGNDAANAIFGRDGNDVIGGRGGEDLLAGNHGKDVMRGGDGADMLAGGKANDSLSGGNGTDALDGGLGTDSCSSGETVTNCE